MKTLVSIVLGLLISIGGTEAKEEQQLPSEAEFRTTYEEQQPVLQKHYEIYKNSKPSEAEFKATYEEIQQNLLNK